MLLPPSRASLALRTLTVDDSLLLLATSPTLRIWAAIAGFLEAGLSRRCGSRRCSLRHESAVDAHGEHAGHTGSPRNDRGTVLDTPAILHNLKVLPQRVAALDTRVDHWIEGRGEHLPDTSIRERDVLVSWWTHPSPELNGHAGSQSMPERSRPLFGTRWCKHIRTNP